MYDSDADDADCDDDDCADDAPGSDCADEFHIRVQKTTTSIVEKICRGTKRGKAQCYQSHKQLTKPCVAPTPNNAALTGGSLGV
jgi:hypothetical protein